MTLLQSHYPRADARSCAPADTAMRSERNAMSESSMNGTIPLKPVAGETITSLLLREHEVLRREMAGLAEWLPNGPSPQAARDRAARLAAPLELHARREDDLLFAALRGRSEVARRLVDLMSLVHDEVHGLFEEIAIASDPLPALWTILDLTETHFQREESELFPLAERLLEPELLVRMARGA